MTGAMSSPIRLASSAIVCVPTVRPELVEGNVYRDNPQLHRPFVFRQAQHERASEAKSVHLSAGILDRPGPTRLLRLDRRRELFRTVRGERFHAELEQL